MPTPPAAGRRHVGVSPTALVKAGSLGHELKGHAFERAAHFFFFIVTMKMVVHELNRLGGAGTPHRHSKWVSVKATDQIGSGLRSEHEVYTAFVKTDPAVVDAPTTRFTKSDAAHFCNLGLKAGFDTVCHASDFTRDGYERLKVYAGNTMQLPQKVNIGPDRKIDVLHGRLALQMLDDDAAVVFSRDRVKTYVEQATLALEAYRLAKASKGEHGLAACAACYLQAYADENFAGRLYRQVYPEIIGLCEASPALKGQAHRFYA